MQLCYHRSAISTQQFIERCFISNPNVLSRYHITTKDFQGGNPCDFELGSQFGTVVHIDFDNGDAWIAASIVRQNRALDFAWPTPIGVEVNKNSSGLGVNVPRKSYICCGNQIVVERIVKEVSRIRYLARDAFTVWHDVRFMGASRTGRCLTFKDKLRSIEMPLTLCT